MRLIVVEGPDYVGKTRTATELVERIGASGRRVRLFSHPGDGEGSSQIRELILPKTKPPFEEAAHLLMFHAALIQLATLLARHKSRRDLDYAVVDRWYYSTFVYQCWCKEAPSYLHDAVVRYVNTLIEPDILVFPYASYETVKARRAARKANWRDTDGSEDDSAAIKDYHRKMDGYARTLPFGEDYGSLRNSDGKSRMPVTSFVHSRPGPLPPIVMFDTTVTEGTTDEDDKKLFDWVHDAVFNCLR